MTADTLIPSTSHSANAHQHAFHDDLLQATHEARHRMLSLPILQEAAQGKVSREDYVRFLTQAFHHVRHTVPLLMACGGKLPARLEWLRTAIAEYIEEELGHHEWVLDDLEALGVDRDSIANGIPAPATELMVSYAYDTIARGNPVGFFGMVLVLEGTSVTLATHVADAVQNSLNLPRNAFRYLRSHGTLDQEHTGFFESLMNRLTDPHDKQAVVHAAKMFYALYGQIFATLRDAPPSRTDQASPR